MPGLGNIFCRLPALDDTNVSDGMLLVSPLELSLSDGNDSLGIGFW